MKRIDNCIQHTCSPFILCFKNSGINWITGVLEFSLKNEMWQIFTKHNIEILL